MKRILVLSTGRGGPAVAYPQSERRDLPPPDAPAEAWDALVAALLAADVIITD